MNKKLDSLLQQFDQTATKVLPVEKWNPPCLGTMDLRIARSGIWYHEGRPIERQSLVRLFASILRRDEDGCYYLVTPVERWRIQVEDVPFIVVEMQVSGAGQAQSIYFRSNVDDWIRLGSDHPLRVDNASGSPAPYVRVRGRLEALLGRPVYYELAEYVEERQLEGRLMYAVYSQGMWFPLAAVPA